MDERTPSTSDSNKTNPPARQRRARAGSLFRSFYYAWQGIDHLFRTQRNARVHLACAAAACGFAAWLRIPRTDWAILILVIASVFILEGINTAIEAAVDLASPELHPLAKAAKDLAAGMVLVASIAAALVGLLIFGPHLYAKFR